MENLKEEYKKRMGELVQEFYKKVGIFITTAHFRFSFNRDGEIQVELDVLDK